MYQLIWYILFADSLFKGLNGVSIINAKKNILLKTGKFSVSDVTLAVGFNDLKYFRDSFKKEFEI